MNMHNLRLHKITDNVIIIHDIDDHDEREIKTIQAIIYRHNFLYYFSLM